MRRRVVVTGMGVISPLGTGVGALEAGLREGRTGIRRMDDWGAVAAMLTRLAGPAEAPEVAQLPRKVSRTMGRVALLSTVASQHAIDDARLSPEEVSSGRVGLAHGSTHGSSSASEQWIKTLVEQRGLLGLSGTTYLKFMSHTTAANLALHFGIRGRTIPTCAACVSSSLAIGQAFETVRSGAMDVMICGGAEELHFSHAAIFDVMHAASSRYNDAPDRSPRPFDRDRDGLVVGEGAGTLVLEEYERARALGKTIHAEILGFGTSCDGTHITNPSRDGMRSAMELALADARLAPSDVGYVNAHATGTSVGDVAESQATRALFGAQVPVSSLKGHLGHTLGACGALEAIASVRMMHGGYVVPTRNLEHPDPACADLDYVMGGLREARFDVFMSNKFAFGGLNTSLVFRAPRD